MARQQKDGEGSAFTDVSDLQDKAAEEAAHPLDADGNPNAAPASAALERESSHRAAASAEGGGPWPPELLARHLDPLAGERVSPELQYTSHEAA